MELNEKFDFEYQPDNTVDPLLLVDRSALPLHHHISPAEDEEDDDLL